MSSRYVSWTRVFACLLTGLVTGCPKPGTPGGETATAPTGESFSASLNEDEPETVTVTGTVADGKLPTYRLETRPSHGKITDTSPSFTYTPDANYHGTDSFTFTVPSPSGRSTTRRWRQSRT